MSNNGLHTPTESLQAEVDELRRRLDKKEQAIERIKEALEAYKHDYKSLLNEVTPSEDTRKYSFNLEPIDAQTLKELDPLGKGNMTRGLRFLLYQTRLDLEALQ